MATGARRAATALVLCLALPGCTGAPVRMTARPQRGKPAPIGALCDALVRDPRSAAALGELMRAASERGDLALPGLCGGRVAFDASGPGAFAPDYFDVLGPAGELEVAGWPRHLRAGAGAALVGLRANRLREPIERHYPPEAIARAVTALAERDAATGGVRVRLLSSLYHEDALVDGRREPLAADFSAPFAALLVRAGPLRASRLSGLFDAEPARGAQLYLMEPYDPRKTPLLMVHGLASTPITWAELTHAIWGDPALRQNYQVWHYHYPTSAPFLYSALWLRRHLDQVRGRIALAGEAEPRPLVVLGHSMGGLLAKALITDSGEAVWRTVFAVPPEALRGRAEDVATVREILHWRARPHVGRVIFVGVPHRGSELAARAVGRVGDAFAGVPPEFAALYARLDAANPGALAPAFVALARGKLSSIDTLSPRHPLLPVLNALPFAPWVRAESVIGDRGAGGPIAESSDGVVPYVSSHLDTVPEVIVPTGHSGLADPATIAAIERLLAQP